jgi:hypothetical protein
MASDVQSEHRLRKRINHQDNKRRGWNYENSKRVFPNRTTSPTEQFHVAILLRSKGIDILSKRLFNGMAQYDLSCGTQNSRNSLVESLGLIQYTRELSLLFDENLSFFQKLTAIVNHLKTGNESRSCRIFLTRAIR